MVRGSDLAWRARRGARPACGSPRLRPAALPPPSTRRARTDAPRGRSCSLVLASWRRAALATRCEATSRPACLLSCSPACLLAWPHLTSIHAPSRTSGKIAAAARVARDRAHQAGLRATVILGRHSGRLRRPCGLACSRASRCARSYWDHRGGYHVGLTNNWAQQHRCRLYRAPCAVWGV